ncbi:MAG: glycosyltransferase family 8 protein [Bacteroidia bacterium]|nr:glycosyltransferase family 8 protein [Bacteroidia bacterium]
MIDIAINIDAKFVPYAHVMLFSLEESNVDESFTVHIINVGLNDCHKKEFYNKHPKMAFHFYDIDHNVISSLPMWRKDYVSVATYLRIFMPDLLPQNVNKVLFLDCDILVLDSIADLWNIDLDSQNIMVAAVEERPPYNTQKPQELKYSPEASYFNAGVALINLKALRMSNFTQRAASFIENYRNSLRHHDQDILNALTAGHTLFISCRWNLLDFFTFKKPDIQPNRMSDLQSALQKPAIVHFSNKRKPWKHNCDNPFRDIYLNKAANYGINIGSNWEINTKRTMRKVLYSIHLKKAKYKKPQTIPFLAQYLYKTT